MPAWLAAALQLALQFGLPILESELPASVVAIIQDILNIIQGAPTQQEGLQKVKDALASLKK